MELMMRKILVVKKDGCNVEWFKEQFSKYKLKLDYEDEVVIEGDKILRFVIDGPFQKMIRFKLDFYIMESNDIWFPMENELELMKARKGFA